MRGSSGRSGLDRFVSAIAARSIPRDLGRRANRAYHRRLGRREYNTTGIDVLDAEWDNLVILDACRHDTLTEVDHPWCDLRTVRSRGSHTAEFIWGNFQGAELRDVVYVTANIMPMQYRDVFANSLHRMVNVWMDGYDETVGTVRPETTTEAALRAADEFPRKRLVVHYLQPHYPFLGNPRPYDSANTMEFWDAVAAGTLPYTAGQVRRWYRENLERTVPRVANLVSGLSGRTVVTADHGTALGERSFPVPIREWGHPWGTYIDPLVKVPWVVVDGERRRTTAGDAGEIPSPSDDDVRDRLEQLGYVAER